MSVLLPSDAAEAPARRHHRHRHVAGSLRSVLHHGLGGSQRLTRAVGKSLAMELILTGRIMGAAEAEASGMVASVVPQDSLMQEALRLANTITEYNSPAVRSAKEAVNRAFESSLAEGILHERRRVPITVQTPRNRSVGRAGRVLKITKRFP
jgi:enoyl-CoA hydratase/carnithine racemase